MTFVWVMLLGGLGLVFGLPGFLLGCLSGVLFSRFVEHRCYKIRHSKAYQRAIAKQKVAATLDPDEHFEKGLDADKALTGNSNASDHISTIFASAAIHNPIDGFATVEAEAKEKVTAKKTSQTLKL